MGFLADLYKTFGLDEEDVKKYRKQYQNTGTGAVVPVEEDTPKKQDNEDSGSGSASSGGTSLGGNTNTTNTLVTDDPAAMLTAYGEELDAQRKEEALQTLWGMTGADNIWGQKEQPKVDTAVEILQPLGLDVADGTAAGAVGQATQASDDEAADHQRLGSGALGDTRDKFDFNPVDWLQTKRQEGQQQMGQYQRSGTGAIYQPQDFGTINRTPSGGVVTGDVDFPDWVDDEGAVTTLPTYEQFMRYITGADKEGGRGTENNQSYLDKSLNQILLGNYTGDVTALGTAGQVAAGFFDLDLPMDIRDLSYDITNWESTPEHIGQTVLDAVGLIPIIGMVKYGDEINALLKGTGKNADEAADVAKEADEAAKGAGNAGTVITEIKYKPSSGVIFKANPDKTTTILGSYDKDMKNIVNEMGNVKSTDFGARKGGFNVLNVPDEMYKTSTRQQFWDDINKPWLDEAISRGDDIVLATIPRGRAISYIDTVTGEEVITGFGREYYYLLEKGYIYDAATKTMKLK